MPRIIKILYLHGMGGGGDSRIPNILKEQLPHYVDQQGICMEVCVRTYDFDPAIAIPQVDAWFAEEKPDLVIGESLGAIHAIRLHGIPHLLISPALGGPRYLYRLAPLMHLRLGRLYADRKWHVKEGDRQRLKWNSPVLRRYRAHFEQAMQNTPRQGSRDVFFAFFGTRDHYMRSGVVRISLWEHYFGPDSYACYEGSHFMENEYLHSLLIPKILQLLELPGVA